MPAVTATEPSDEHDVGVPGPDLRDGLADRDAARGGRGAGRRVLDQPVRAVRLTKELIDPSLSFEEYCERAIEYQWQCVNDDEYKEAVAAFSERRAPEYDRDYS